MRNLGGWGLDEERFPQPPATSSSTSDSGTFDREAQDARRKTAAFKDSTQGVSRNPSNTWHPEPRVIGGCMNVEAAATAPAAGNISWTPEWWERVRDRRAAWTARHTVLMKQLLVARLVLLAVAVVWLVVAMLVVGSVRAAMVPVYVGCVWICVLWFLLLRTKTLTFAGYMRLFVVATMWSVVAGVVLRQVAITASPLAQEGGFAARVALGALGEESLKLVPVLAIVLAAPGRVRRYSSADWALLGLASGAGFLAAEEILRRLNVYGPQVSIFGERYNLDGAVQFGLTGLDDAGVTRLTWWPGHHVVTMLITLSVGLAIALWRASRGRDLPRRVAAGVGAVVLVAGVFWSAVTTHAYYNLGTGTSPNILPAPLQWWHTVTPDEFAAPWMLVLAVVAVLIVDGTRLRRWGGWSTPLETPAWATRLDDQLAGVAAPAGAHPALAHVFVGAAGALRSLVFVAADTVRGAGLFVCAGARQPDEPWWAGPRRAHASVVMNRQSRELTLHLDAPPARPWVLRAVALGVGAVLLWLTFTVAPDWVRHLDGTSYAERLDESWLAQLFDGLARWWNDLSGLEKTLAIGTVVLLSGGTLALAGAGAGSIVLGSAAWGSGAFSVSNNAEHLAAFTRDPVGAVRDYWNTATPGSLLLDGAVLAFTAWAPSKLATPVRGRIDDFVDDQGQWLRRRTRHDVDESSSSTPTPTSPREPGSWSPATESMSERSAKYQEQVTGARMGTVYRVNNVKFDGFEDGVLVEAKGPGLDGFVKDGEFRPWFRGKAEFLKQAQRQLDAADGAPIRWDVAEPRVAEALDELFFERSIPITVRHVPAQ